MVQRSHVVLKSIHQEGGKLQNLLDNRFHDHNLITEDLTQGGFIVASHTHEFKFKNSRVFKALTMLGLATLVILVAACGNSPAQTGSQTTTLRVVHAPGQAITDLFNPYFDDNHGGDWGVQGLVYETLDIINLYNGTDIPMLATSHDFNSTLTQLTFHLRSGVKWNDGSAFTSADVVATFQELKKYPALDTTGASSYFTTVTAPDASTVVFTLPAPDSLAVFHLGGGIYIMPQSVLNGISGDPAKFANDSKPVGTGPYTLASWNPNLITYQANSSYWGTKPAVKTIQVPVEKDNSTAITDMISGKLDWMGTGWNPSLDPAYLGKSAHNQEFFAPSNTVMLYLNLQKAPFNNLNFRKAVSAAIVRSALPTGVAAYAQVADPTGVVIPNNKSWITTNAKFDAPSQVDGYMTAAGFKKGSDGYYEYANGQPFSMNVNVPGPWSDWAQDVQNIVTNLNTAGIKAYGNFQANYDPYFPDLSTGNYDAAISWTNSGPTPYYAYQALLASSNSAAAGKAVSGTNFERWDSTTSNGYSAQTDALLAQYESTTDQTKQQAAISGIEQIMVSQIPAIPLTVNVTWDEYTTSNWIGWPSTSNPYDVGAPYQMPDAENVILHLKPAH
jgi:peptide/nickel transport system substrate-binding protein